MPRIARIVVPGVPHHVTQRGNNRQDVFFVDDDRSLYLKILREESIRHGAAVLGYCLMTNHTHLVIVPKRADSLAGALVGRTGVTRRPSIACTVVAGISGKTAFTPRPWTSINAKPCSTSSATRSAPACAARRRVTLGPVRRPMWMARTKPACSISTGSPGILTALNGATNSPPACPRLKKSPFAIKPPAVDRSRATSGSPGSKQN